MVHCSLTNPKEEEKDGRNHHRFFSDQAGNQRVGYVFWPAQPDAGAEAPGGSWPRDCAVRGLQPRSPQRRQPAAGPAVHPEPHHRHGHAAAAVPGAQALLCPAGGAARYPGMVVAVRRAPAALAGQPGQRQPLRD